MRQCLEYFNDMFNFPNCQKIFYVYNSLSEEWMNSFKDLKCPPVVFIHTMRHPFMTEKNLKAQRNVIWIFDGKKYHFLMFGQVWAGHLVKGNSKMDGLKLFAYRSDMIMV